MTRLLLIAFLINTTCLYAQDIGKLPVAPLVQDYDLKEHTKSIYEITYATKLENRVLLDSTVRLDTLQFRNKETNVTFNTNGYAINSKVDSFDRDAKTILSREHRWYYKDGKLSGIAYYFNGKQIDSTSISYNRKGEAAKQTHYDKKGKMLKQVQYFYRYGNVFNIKVRDEEGMLQKFIRFKYDLAGNLTEQEIKGSTMQYEHSYKYRYDTLKDGTRQVNKFDYVGKYKCRSMERQLFDSRSNMTELVITDSFKRVVLNKTMKYSPNGLLRSELVFTRFKNAYDYYYQYEKGTWKTKYVVLNDRLISKTHRVVEYYNEEVK